MNTKINALAGHRVTGYAQIKKLVLAVSSTVLLSGVVLTMSLLYMVSSQR